MNVAQIIVVEPINIVVGVKYVVMQMKYVVGIFPVWNITVIHPAGMRSQTRQAALKRMWNVWAVL